MSLWYLKLPLHKVAGYVKKKKKQKKKRQRKSECDSSEAW